MASYSTLATRSRRFLREARRAKVLQSHSWPDSVAQPSHSRGGLSPDAWVSRRGLARWAKATAPFVLSFGPCAPTKSIPGPWEINDVSCKTYMLFGYPEAVRKEIDDPAVIDGCSTIGTIFHAIMPITLPGLVASATHAFIVAWNVLTGCRSYRIRKEHIWRPFRGRR